MANRKTSIRFYLRDAKAQAPTPIILKFRYKKNADGETVLLKHGTGRKILPKFWSGQVAKESLNHPEFGELNLFLSDLRRFANEVVERQPNIELSEFKSLLDEKCGYNTIKADKQRGIPLVPEYVGTYIKRKPRHERTIKKFRALKSKLTEYQKDTGLELTFEAMTLDFKENFCTWLTSKGLISKNTHDKYIVDLKTVLKEAAKDTAVIDGVMVKINPYKEYEQFAVGRIKTSKHYLTLEELALLEKIDFSNDVKREIVLDYFLMMCYTGLRVSDIKTLEKSHFITDSDGFEVIKLYTYKGKDTKADNEVVIPVLPQMRKIVEKYNYIFPKPMTEQEHNRAIKEIAKEAGINRIEQHKTGDSNIEAVPIWSKISNHTGRYTFINFMLNEYGVTPHQLTKITGQSLDVLMGYERGDKKRNAKAVISKINPNLSILKVMA